MITEKWDILDEKGVPTGRQTLRGQTLLKSGEYHLVVHIWIISSDNRFLIQKRSESRKMMPGEWAATGGAAISGEDSFSAANRELYEELGIKSNPDTLKKLFRIKRKNSLLDVWFIESNADISELKLQENEVAEAKWVDADVLKEMIENGEFHNYGNEYFTRVFTEIENSKGAFV